MHSHKCDHIKFLIRALIYVGETSQSLKERITQITQGLHRSAINRKDLKIPVATHFCECNHNILSFFFLGILFPKGMNEDFFSQRVSVIVVSYIYIYILVVGRYRR